MDDFEDWYSRYPRKVAKGAARRAFKTAMKKTTLAELNRGLEYYKRTKPAKIDWCYPATWLNGERWLDGQETKPAAPVKAAVFVKDDTPQWHAWQRYMKQTTGRGSPVHNFGWYFESEWPDATARD